MGGAYYDSKRSPCRQNDYRHLHGKWPRDSYKKTDCHREAICVRDKQFSEQYLYARLWDDTALHLHSLHAPDKAAVPAGIGLSGTAVAETFNPQPPAGTVTGDGSLNANSQFGDRISYCSSSPLTISTTVTQTLSIEGYQVRQNTLKNSSAGVTYTNLGPFQ
jgi:hypothetical protein